MLLTLQINILQGLIHEFNLGSGSQPLSLLNLWRLAKNEVQVHSVHPAPPPHPPEFRGWGGLSDFGKLPNRGQVGKNSNFRRG